MLALLIVLAIGRASRRLCSGTTFRPLRPHPLLFLILIGMLLVPRGNPSGRCEGSAAPPSCSPPASSSLTRWCPLATPSSLMPAAFALLVVAIPVSASRYWLVVAACRRFPLHVPLPNVFIKIWVKFALVRPGIPNGCRSWSISFLLPSPRSCSTGWWKGRAVAGSSRQVSAAQDLLGARRMSDWFRDPNPMDAGVEILVRISPLPLFLPSTFLLGHGQ